MSFSKDDYRQIHWGVIMLSTATLAIVVLVGGSQWVGNEKEKQFKKTQSEAADMQKKVARARDEERKFTESYSRYQVLVTRGIIGDEKRLDWIEKIREIRETRQLFEIKYTISPQQTYKGSAALDPGNYDIYASRMKLDMNLLHEEDLLIFLEDLSERAEGLFAINECEMSTQTVAATAGYVPRLTASCSLDWITLKEKSATSNKAVAR